MVKKKILIIRFSSIGDIVLTTPVIRCIKQQLPNYEVHYVSKESFRSILSANPYIDRLITFKNEVSEVFEELNAQQFDSVIDLHKNLRSLRLKRKLKIKSYSFDKINIRKLLAVNFKWLKLLPNKHIVDRYFEPLETLGVKNDGLGLDYFIEASDEINVAEKYFGKDSPVKYISLVVGGSYYTKKIPIEKLKEICELATLPIIVLGSKDDKKIADELQQFFPTIINTCGDLSINQSASIVRQSEWVITSDTGLMHIATAFKRRIISVWGNTIPEFGMAPYMPISESKIYEIKDLKCRPCSKLGFKNCPAGHFKCMREIDFSELKDLK